MATHWLEGVWGNRLWLSNPVIDSGRTARKMNGSAASSQRHWTVRIPRAAAVAVSPGYALAALMPLKLG